MQVLTDYIFSLILVGIVLLVVMTIKIRGEEASLDATQYRAAKLGMMSLVQVMEQDFNNIGAQKLGLLLNPDDAITAFDTNSVPAVFEFWTRGDSLQLAKLVRYEWQPMPGGKSVQLKRGAVPLYEVTRRLNGAPAGMSTNMITRFEIHLLTADSTSDIVNINGAGMQVRQVLVRLKAVSPLGAGSSIEETRWEKVFRPPNLWKRRET